MREGWWEGGSRGGKQGGRESEEGTKRNGTDSCQKEMLSTLDQ